MIESARRRRWLIGIGAVAFVWWLFSGRADAPHSAATVLPESTHLYLEVPDCGRFGAMLSGMPFWAGADRGERAARHVRTALAARVAPFMGNPPVTDVEAFFSHASSLSLALVPMRTPTWVLSLQTDSPARLMRMLERDFSLPGRDAEVEDAPVRSFRLSEGPMRLWALPLGSLLVLTWSETPDMVRHIIRIHRGEMVPLKAGRDFDRRRQAVSPDAVGWMYVDLRGMARELPLPGLSDALLRRIDVLSLSLAPSEGRLVFSGDMLLTKAIEAVFPVVPREDDGMIMPGAWCLAALRADLVESKTALRQPGVFQDDARRGVAMFDAWCGVPVEPALAAGDGRIDLRAWRSERGVVRALAVVRPADNAEQLIEQVVARAGAKTERSGQMLSILHDGAVIGVFVRDSDRLVYAKTADIARGLLERMAADAAAPEIEPLPLNDDRAPLVQAEFWPGRAGRGHLGDLIDSGVRCSIRITGGHDGVRFHGVAHPAAPVHEPEAEGGVMSLVWGAVKLAMLAVFFFFGLGALLALKFIREARAKGIAYSKVVPVPGRLPDDAAELLAPRHASSRGTEGMHA